MEKPRVEITDHGATVFFNRYLYSRHNPVKRPESVAQNIPIESCCLYFIPSPLLGYGIRSILERIPDDSHVIAIELSQDLFQLCAPHIERNLLSSQQLSLARLSDEESLQEFLEKIGLWRFRRVLRIDLNAGPELYPELYDRLVKFAENTLVTYWRNRRALGVLGRLWIRHLHANLNSYPSRKAIEKIEKPIIVAGAGPSLETSLDFIAQHRDRVEIWATDTALGTLLMADIKPDMVSILETQTWNHLDFHDSANTGIPVIADITSYPESLHITGGPLSLYSSAFAKLNFLKRLEKFCPDIPKIPALGSIGLATVHLALSTSQGPVLLTGLDFSYVPGKTHACGSSIHKWQIANMMRTNPLPGWKETMHRPRLRSRGYNGVEINTDRILKGYAELFRDRFGTSNRLYALSGGLDIGVPLVSASRAIGLISQFEAQKKHLQPPSRNTAIVQNMQCFLRNEIVLLEQTIRAWEKYSEGDGDASVLIGNLEELDHICCDFPDKPPLSKMDDGYLFRTVARCRELLRYIRRLQCITD